MKKNFSFLTFENKRLRTSRATSNGHTVIKTKKSFTDDVELNLHFAADNDFHIDVLVDIDFVGYEAKNYNSNLFFFY